MIFKTISDETTLSGQRIVGVLQARKIAQQQATAQLEIDIACLKEYQIACQNGTVTTKQFDTIMHKASASAIEYSAKIKAGIGTAQSYATAQRATNAALQEVSIGAGIASKAVKLFSATLNMIAFTAIIQGISWLIGKVDEWIITADEAKESADAFKESLSSFFAETQSNLKTITSLSDRFNELSKNVDANGKQIGGTKEEYDEFLGICEQVGQIMPELITGYTNEGQAIIVLRNKVDSLTESYENAIRAKAALFLSNGDDDGNTIESLFDDYNNFVQGDQGFLGLKMSPSGQDTVEEFEQYYGYDKIYGWLSDVTDAALEDLQSLRAGTTEYVYLARVLKEAGYDISEISADNYNAIHDVFNRRMTVMEQGITDRVTNIKNAFQNMLYADSEYWKIEDDNIISAINSVYASIDDEFIKQNNLFNTTALQNFESDLISLFTNNETKQAMLDFYTPMSSEESVKEYSDRIVSALQTIQNYCNSNGLVVPIQFGESGDIIDSYANAIESVKKKFKIYYQDKSIETFFDEYSINTEEEINKFIEIANSTDTATEAMRRYKEECYIKPSSEGSLITKESIDNAKNYQSELKSLYEALNLLRSGIATPTAINELIQKFPELSKHIDDLEGGIEELVEKKLEELRKAFDGAINEEALKRLAEYSVKQEAIADSIKSTTSALNDMTSAYKNVADAMKQYNDTGYISLELLESIMAMKPEYLGALLDEWNNMNNAADAYKAYVKVRLAEYEAEAWAESNTNRREALAQYYVDGDRIKYDKAVETSIDALAAKLKFVQGIRDNLDKWVSGIGSSSSSSSSSTFDWLEVFLKRIEEKINKVKKVASDTWKSWTDRGKALNSVISETNKELSAQEKAYETYLDEANKVELSDTLKKRVIEGDPTLPNDKSIDSGTRDKINEFKDLYEKAIEAKDKVDDLRQSLQEYASQRISNISKQFDDQISSIEAKKENLDNRITYLSENGISNAIDIYEALIERENEILIENTQKKKALESELTNYNVGTEAWYELKSKINDVSSAIDESRISLVKFENEIRQAKWDGFDRLIDKINLVIEESDFLTEVLSYDELIDDMGSYTSEGLSTLALHKSNYDVNLAEAKGYTEELKQLRQELADNPVNQKLIDRENELQKAQRDTILSAYKEKQAMIDLEKEAIQKQIEAMNKLIDKKKEALNVEKDLYDYQKNLKSKTDNIANLQKQIAVYSQDNSEAGMQKLQSLQKQLSDAQEDLKDTQYDKWVQEQQNMLDELMEEYETVQNEAMNNTDKKFNELCTVIEDNQDRIVEAINNLSNGLVSNNASDNLNDTLMGTSVEDLIGYINDSINEITQAETDKLVEKFNDEVSVPFDNIQSIADSNDKRIELTDDIKNNVSEVKDELTDIDSSIESSSESIVEQLGKVKNVVENCFSVTGTWFSNLSEDLKSLVESNSTATSGKSIAGHSYIMDQLLNGGKLITTGGRPIAGLKGYATGLRKSTSNHLAWTQENGLELIYRKYDGAMLTPIGNGDTVFTADMTDNLWNIANSFKPLDVSAIKKQSSNSNSVLSIGQLVLPNVKNYEEFRNELVKDNLFKNEIAKSTANKIVTTNKL